MSAQLIELSNALAQITERAAASAVAVHTEARGSSSGVVWRPGIIVTAEHALQRDEDIQVTLGDGRVAAATLAGRDPSTDLAALKCEDASAKALEFGEASSLKAGSLTLIVGRTRASGPVAALGVVSLATAERRNWTGGNISPYIRLDVGLQPTSIGGAVVGADGSVVGIATPRFARFGAIVIPASTVHRVLDALLEKGHIPRGYLGAGLQHVRLPDAIRGTLQRKEKTAVIVLEVDPDGPAHKAGIIIGDVLVSLGGQPVIHLQDVQSQLRPESIGKPLAVKIVRGGVLKDLNITIAERPAGGN
jgi:S1-C subfamily serine protease